MAVLIVIGPFRSSIVIVIFQFPGGMLSVFYFPRDGHVIRNALIEASSFHNVSTLVKRVAKVMAVILPDGRTVICFPKKLFHEIAVRVVLQFMPLPFLLF